MKTTSAIAVQGFSFHVVRHDDLDRDARLFARIESQYVTHDAFTRTLLFTKREPAQICSMLTALAMRTLPHKEP